MNDNNNKKGNLFIISAPSGAGKSTLSGAVLKKIENLEYSISYTTRTPRKGEQDGVDYFFIEKEDFISNIKKNYWIEWAKVHDNYYGTSFEFIENKLSRGINIFLDIDVQGTEQILKKYPDAITIFIMPPSMEVLKERLVARGTDSNEIIKKRLLNAQEEIKKKELYHTVIVNNNLSEAVDKLSAIIKKNIHK